MKTLLRLFSALIVKVSAIYVVVAIVGILALDRMFGGYEFYLGMLVFIAPLISWALTLMCVPKNLDWIMALPISKRNVVVLNYLTSLLANASIFGASVFVLLVLAVVKADRHVSVTQIARNAPSLVPEAKLQPYLAGIDIYGWMTGLLMLSFFHALSMSISRPATTKRFYFNLWNHSNPTMRWTVRTGWLGALALCAIFREYALSPFGVFVAATFTFLFVTTVNTSHALGISKVQRTRWLRTAGAVVGVQVIFLFVTAMDGVRSASFDRRVSSVMFLGPFSGGLAKSDLARLLEADINQDRVEELGELYRRRHHAGARVRRSQDRDLDFVRAVSSKHTYADVMAALRVFDATELTAADLEALFTKLQPLIVESRSDFPVHELLAARVDGGAFLDSREEVAMSYALLWARYRARPGDAALASRIEKRMPKLPDRLKLSALLTLSVLTGKRYTLDDWMAGRKGRKLSSSANPIDCTSWTPRALVDIGAAEAAAVNACVRQRAEPGQVPEIEAAGWMEPPFDTKTRLTIRKILKIR